jgi:hypothetical protein
MMSDMEERFVDLHEMMEYLQNELLKANMIATEDELVLIIQTMMRYFVDKGIFHDYVEYEEE